MKKHMSATGVVCALLACGATLHAEVYDSGYVENTGSEPAVIYSTTVTVSVAHSVYLNFQSVQLSGDEQAGTGSYLMMTSTLDGGLQIMHASHLTQWANRSGFLNGESVQIELVAYPGTGQNRIVFEPLHCIDRWPGSSPVTDPRALSDDPRVGRVANSNGYVYCTAFIIDDACHCLLTAWHCGAGVRVIEFNVPPSNAAGNPMHAVPSDQYAVDLASRWPNPDDPNEEENRIGDWRYFGCFPNSNTGLTPFEAQQAYFDTARVPTPVAGQTVRITGYGQSWPPTPNTHNHAQTTSTGPYTNYSDSDPDRPTVQAAVQVSMANSGSPMLNLDACEVLGIVSGGILSEPTGAAITTPALLAALAAPRGVCILDCNGNGIPDWCDINCGDPNGPCDVPGCGQSTDFNGNGVPDECEDCNGNGIPDKCDLDCGDPNGPCDVPGCGQSADIDGNGVPDECEDCNGNGIPDGCDIDCGDPNGPCDVPNCGQSSDCNSNGIPDECEPDCNGNGEPDDCDILLGVSEDCNCNRVPDECDVDPNDPDGDGRISLDCNANFVPDECEEDCNGNSVPDDCDLDPNDPDGNGEVSIDCNETGVPDECEDDCNNNGIADSCDLDPNDPDGNGEVSEDCNGNGYPDECLGWPYEPDCNNNGVPDDCDVDPNDPDGDGHVSEDCNGNGVPDECDIADESSLDCNANGVPDECELADCQGQAWCSDCNGNGVLDGCDIAGFGECFVSGFSPLYGHVDQYDLTSGKLLGEFIRFTTGGLLHPLGATFHPNGSLLVGDEDPNTVRQYDGVTGDYLGDFVASGAGGLSSPWDMTFGPDGELYVANVAPASEDTGVLKYDDLTGESLGTFVSDPNLPAPYGLTFGPNGDLFVCDNTRAEVREYDGTTGAPVGVFTSPGGIYLDGPCALAFHPVSGNLFVADAVANDVVEFNGSTGAFVRVFIDDVGGYGDASLMDIKFGSDDELYVSHNELISVYKYDGDTGALLAELPETDYTAFKPFRLAFRPALADCNANGVPESCEPPDSDADSDVDFADFMSFQSCFASSGAPCLATFDRSAPCGGPIDMYDLQAFDVHFAGPDTGGGRDGGGEDSDQPADEPWTFEYAGVTLELQPAGGGEAVTVLAADTAYEVHYAADYNLNCYALYAVANSANHGFAAASGPPDGDWFNTGGFTFTNLQDDNDADGGAPGYPDGYERYQMVADELWPADDARQNLPDHAGRTGQLCNVTTQAAGDLNVQLYAWWIDESERLSVEMTTQATFVVAASDDD